MNSMALFKDEVIVIKSINYGEADKILTVIGRNFGKFPLLAKGIRKIDSKNRGNMQTLSASEICFYRNRGMGVLTESKHVFSPEYSDCNIKGIERTLFLLYKFVEEDGGCCEFYDKLFFVLKSGFKDDDVNKFRLVFLKSMGLLSYKTCTCCGNSEDMEYIDLKNFELFCKNCYSKSLRKVKELDYLSPLFTRSLDSYVLKVLD